MNDKIDIRTELKNDPVKTISKLTNKSKSVEVVEENREEYNKLRRNIRNTQIDTTQKDKQNAAGVNIVQSRIPIPIQKKIVNTATAFEVGEKVTLSPNKDNDLSEEILRLWRVNRMDSKLQDLIRIKKSETESAILFYINEIKPTGLFNRILGLNNKKEIKSTILQSKNGIMTPYFDETGDMVAFVWRYVVTQGDKTINYTVVYDDTNCYTCNDDGGEMTLKSTLPHGFGKIPVVYLSQDNTEWFDVQIMIDRFETAMSKLADSNDYTGHPLLKLYGEVVSMPKKGDNGKTLRFPKKIMKDGKEISGDAEFLTNSQGPESVKLELDRLEKLIMYLTNTPQLSLEDLKGIGAVSGVAIKLLFLDAMIKAKLNEGPNSTTIDRILNVMIAGTVTTISTKIKKQSEETYFDITFNSIIPSDLNDIIDYISRGKEAGIISQKTSIKEIGLVENVNEEQDLIKQDEADKAKEITQQQ